jgi:Putative peptidoglycan binding domain
MSHRVYWAASTAVALLVTALLAMPVDAQRGREDGCKSEEIKAAGKASIFGKAAAMRNAIDNWQREVRNKYGERYMVWDRARGKKQECEAASIGRLGRLNQRCTVSAYACAAVQEAEAPLGECWDIQRMLHRAGYLRRDDVDGDCQEKTRRAMRRFQRDERLQATGEVNEETWRRLRRRS